MRRRRAALLVATVSLALLAAMMIWAAVIQRQASEAEVTTFGDRHASVAPELPVPLRAAPTQQPPVLSPPTRIRIPAIGVNSAVIPVGVDRNHAVRVPSDILTIGWYRLGVPPGSPSGSAVLVGHRDGLAQGHGALYDLGSLRQGDPIVVTTKSGDQLVYRVVAREAVSKLGFPKEAGDLFAVVGSPRLTLISCGGYYDANNGGYQDNIVVTAAPQVDAP